MKRWFVPAAVILAVSGILLVTLAQRNQNPDATTNTSVAQFSETSVQAYQPKPDPSMQEIVDALPDFSDAQLREWIRANNNSEAAWLAAYSYRPHFVLRGEWLGGGLRHHPNSLPLVMMAANADLLAFHANSASASRIWMDHFLKLDPDNGLAWFMSALAEYARGNTAKGDEHWIRASEAPGYRFYTVRFENSLYDFVRGMGFPSTMATIASGTAPILNIPKINVESRAIRDRADALRLVGLAREGDALVIAGYFNAIRLLDRDVADNSWAIYQLVGLSMFKIFRDQVSEEIRRANADAEEKIAAFEETCKEVHGKWSHIEDFTESEFLAYDYYRRTFGELAAVEQFAD